MKFTSVALRPRSNPSIHPAYSATVQHRECHAIGQNKGLRMVFAVATAIDIGIEYSVDNG